MTTAHIKCTSTMIGCFLKVHTVSHCAVVMKFLFFVSSCDTK